MSNLSDLLPAGAGAKSADFVATGTLSSGQTVALKGGVSGKVTGLTIGSDYYVQDDGTVTTVTSTVPAGRALSATSILLEG